ncbi:MULTISPECIES: glycerol-3-phosphate responsive antiterminator [Kyrpidia]|uniref:Glycerol-3-phosphate responsive antiterminator n=1 Tax=Kyrpidia spormannii TaxID=2055160 RepID=A0ACA8Z5Q5_9BACL|nr:MULTISPECIES: glycerol-3-phosphate responsive antiterminator [Kyrpidia]MCL6575151.1 glycerol-3-phosphate responsive antiterminator [Kyrpidia sp.]CAB3390041.1 Glycerol-3-phosphate responsive antiterminator [Kyrpidia spormannii]HHY66936.1 glycerol-3-phosphate responsive antiterminator [Alicyclobacillus sp.]
MLGEEAVIYDRPGGRLRFRDSIILSIHEESLFETALATPVEDVFLLIGDVCTLPKYMERLRRYGKRVFLHMDMMKGLSPDKAALRYVAETLRPAGIVSTKSQVVRAAKSLGLAAVQRLFLIDRPALELGLRTLAENRPDAVEIMPGLMPRVIREVVDRVSIPVIAGGLIQAPDEVGQALAAGARAVSLGRPELWRWTEDQVRTIQQKGADPE